MCFQFYRHKLYLDGYGESTKRAYEFYGDYWHGNPQVFGNKYQDKYDKQWHEKAVLESNGIKVIEMWEMTGTQEKKD